VGTGGWPGSRAFLHVRPEPADELAMSRPHHFLRRTRWALGLAIVAALFAISPLHASTEAVLRERPTGGKGGRGYEALVIDCEARLAVPGLYQLTPTIQMLDGCSPGWIFPGTVFGQPAGASRRLTGNPDAEAGELEVRTDAEGRLRFRVEFDWPGLRRLLSRDGPWRFCCECSLLDPRGASLAKDSTGNYLRESLCAMTGPWIRSRFRLGYADDFEPFFEGDPFDFRTVDELIPTQQWDLIVATVVSSDSAGTAASPPEVVLHVDEVLYGRLQPEDIHTRWRAVPLDLPCPVGEAPTIARWNGKRVGGPEAGSRWILVGDSTSRQPGWTCSSRFRWPYSDSLRSSYQARIATWPAYLEELRREEALAARAQKIALREQTRREARASERRKALEDRTRKARAAEQRKAERSEHAAAVLRWRTLEVERTRSADLPSLVRMSSEIVAGEVVASRQGQSKLLELTSVEWLRASDPRRGRPQRIRVLLGERERALASRWFAIPLLDTSGGRRPRPVRCIAFLRVAHDSLGTGDRALTFRPVGPTTGLFLADDRALARTRTAVAERGTLAPEPLPGCGAELREFSALDDSSAKQVGIIVTPMAPAPPGSWRCTLVLTCRWESWGGRGNSSPDWFATCGYPDSSYSMRFGVPHATLHIDPPVLAALVDSLSSRPGLTRGRDPAAEWHLMLRKETQDGERVLECSLGAREVREFIDLVANLIQVDQVTATFAITNPRETHQRISLREWMRSAIPEYRDRWRSQEVRRR
jgi:hypothetical protein